MFDATLGKENNYFSLDCTVTETFEKVCKNLHKVWKPIAFLVLLNAHFIVLSLSSKKKKAMFFGDDREQTLKAKNRG